MENNQKAVKAGLAYTIGNILIKGIGFLTIPIFSRLFSTEEFGIFNVFLSYESVLYVLIGLAMHSSIQNAKLEFPNNIDDYMSSISLVYIGNTLFSIVLFLVFKKTIISFTGLNLTALILLALYSFANAYISLYSNYLSLNYEYHKYLLLSLANSIGNILLSILFIFLYFYNYKIMGRLYGATISALIVASYIIILVFSKSRPAINQTYIEFGLKYSLPIVPHGISQVLLSQIDRIMISYYLGNSSAGIYSLAGNVKLILTVITESITTVWRTWFYKEMQNNNKYNIREKGNCMIFIFFVFTIFVMAISPEIIIILGGKEYLTARNIAIPMVCEGFVLFAYGLIVQSEYFMKKTSFIMYGTMAASFMNIILNYYSIRSFGLLSAAYTTLFSYIVYLLVHFFISYKTIGFPVISVKLFSFLLVAVSLFLLLDLLLINHLAIRYSLNAIAILLLMLYIIKKYNLSLSKAIQELKKRVSKQK